MRFEIHFNHMARSEHLEQYVRERVEPMVEEFLHRGDCHVMVWLINIHSRVQKGVPEFRCEIEVRYPPKRDIFVAKSADEMHAAINAAVDAMSTHLSEDGKREINARRNAPPARAVGFEIPVESSDDEVSDLTNRI